MVSHETMRETRVISALKRYALEVLVAVRPPDLPGLPALMEAYAAAGVTLALWPMLGDEQGRWANVNNAPVFCDFVRRTIEPLEARGLAPGEIVFDLEPDIAEVSTLFSRVHHDGPVRRPWGTPARAAIARSEFERLLRELHTSRIRATATVVPLVLLESERSGRGLWQRAMGTPIDGLRWDHVNVMLYSSMFEGWSLNTMRRTDTLGLLAAFCTATRERFGTNASVSLGAVGVGALGDEPTYRAVRELAEDVAVARACGIDDLALFDLGGVLSRAPMESWLHAFTETPSRSGELPGTWRSGAAMSGGRWVTRLLGLIP